jgi:uncharacterized membrane protein YgaE (UPF0421/DUF939 family)
VLPAKILRQSTKKPPALRAHSRGAGCFLPDADPTQYWRFSLKGRFGIMIKKALISAVALTLVGGFFFGRDLFSYVGTSVGWVKGSVRDAVPIEFEIERARKMVKNLVPDIRKNMHAIAREEVEIQRLESQIAETEGRLDRDKSSVLKLKSDLESGSDTYQYASHKYSRNEVKKDLTHRFELYKTNEATLTSLREIMSARQRSLNAAQQKLADMQVQKRQLEVQVENIEARLKMVEAAQTTCDYNFDDSQLSRVKELLTDLHTKLEVSERLVNSEAHYGGEIEIEETISDDIVDEVTHYFTTKQQPQVAASPSH